MTHSHFRLEHADGLGGSYQMLCLYGIDVTTKQFEIQKIITKNLFSILWYSIDLDCSNDAWIKERDRYLNL